MLVVIENFAGERAYSYRESFYNAQFLQSLLKTIKKFALSSTMPRITASLAVKLVCFLGFRVLRRRVQKGNLLELLLSHPHFSVSLT